MAAIQNYLWLCCIGPIRYQLILCRSSQAIWGVPLVGIPALLISPHFFERPTLALDSFIDIVGQNWPRNAELCTPLQQTVIQRGPPPRWPQVSEIAIQRKKLHISPDKEAFSGNTVKNGLTGCTVTESKCSRIAQHFEFHTARRRAILYHVIGGVDTIKAWYQVR